MSYLDLCFYGVLPTRELSVLDQTVDNNILSLLFLDLECIRESYLNVSAVLSWLARDKTNYKQSMIYVLCLLYICMHIF